MGMAINYFSLKSDKFIFLRNKVLAGNPIKIDDFTEQSFFIEGSFEGLKFILEKGLGHSVKELCEPDNTICYYDFDSEEFKNLSLDEQIDIRINNPVIHFIAPESVDLLNTLIRDVSEFDIEKWYDSDELNQNKIYPEIWHSSETEDQDYNSKNLVQNFNELRHFIKNASKENLYVIVEIR